MQYAYTLSPSLSFIIMIIVIIARELDKDILWVFINCGVYSCSSPFNTVHIYLTLIIIINDARRDAAKAQKR